ncbi:MAG: hypothetical protein NZ534_03715, partial [Bacteroidia bacterium]|nr:hypothetical protein [Bacteroidia bacterium]
MKRAAAICTTVLCAALSSGLWAQEPPKRDKHDDPRLNTPVPFTLGDRDRLHTVELKLEALEKTVDLRFDAMQKQIDARFEAIQRQTDARFEAVDKRLELIQGLLWTLIGVMVALGSG